MSNSRYHSNEVETPIVLSTGSGSTPGVALYCRRVTCHTV